MKIIITGSEGLIGKELSNYLSKNHQVIKLDLTLGHDLTNEKFVMDWFRENHADSLINCFALNDHVAKGEKRPTLFEFSLESFNKFLEINLTALFSVCREFARCNIEGTIVNFSASTGIVSARPDLYEGGHKHPAYSISKAGVINMTKFLATHLAPKIRVNCVSPGGIELDQDEQPSAVDGGPTHPVQHQSLELRSLEAEPVVAQRGSEHTAITVGSRPRHWLWNAGEVRGEEDVIALVPSELGVQLVVGDEVLDTCRPWMVRLFDVDLEPAIRRVCGEIL